MNETKMTTGREVEGEEEGEEGEEGEEEEDNKRQRPTESNLRSSKVSQTTPHQVVGDTGIHIYIYLKAGFYSRSRQRQRQKASISSSSSSSIFSSFFLRK